VSILLKSFVQGLGSTLGRMTEPKATTNYPEEARDMPEWHRGRVTLRPELCIGCTQCSMACPNASCTMTPGPEAPQNKKGLYPQVNVGQCMYCGLCEEVCPTDAIFLDKEFRMVHTDRAYFDYDWTDQSSTEGETRVRRHAHEQLAP
jgi:NADH-quinone oxidoreductase subunit I